MARPRDDDVRRQIILATFDCVARKGVAGMSLREIARIVGLSTGTITYHFGSRRDLLLDAVDYGYWRLPADFVELEPLESFRWIIRRYELSDTTRRTWWRFWLAVTGEAQSDPQIAQRLVEQHRSIVDRWRSSLDRGIARGQMRTDLDPVAEAARLSAFAHGLAISQLIDPARVDWAAAELARAVEALRVPAEQERGASTGRRVLTDP